MLNKIFVIFVSVLVALNVYCDTYGTNEAVKVGKLSNGILEIIQKNDGGNWYYCGELLSKDRQKEIATSIAYQTISNQRSIGLEDVSPWGIVATAYNESRFDACALGLHPRKWAYEKGLLKRKKTNITHSKQEILKFINNPTSKKKYGKSGFDLGYCQVLSRFYRGQESEMLSNDIGMRICVIEMQERSRYNKTTMPWLYWKGAAKTNWYRKKIRKWARMMGASKEELRKI